jgi:putative ABC transport system permease protein
MLRSALAAAIRHLARNRWFAAIGVLGLALGLAAALLAGLILRDQLGRDHFIAGHERIYMAMTSVTPPGRATVHMNSANSFIAPYFKLKFSQVEATTRLFPDNARLRRGEVAASEGIYWADTNAFELLPLPAIAGELRTALARPDGVVLTRAIARRYFGRDTPLGETLLLAGPQGDEPLTVMAVIEDLPRNGTHLASGIFISTLSPRSSLQRMDRIPGNVPGSPVGFGTLTYLRLAPGVAPERLRQALPAAVQALFSRPPPDWKIELRLLRIDELNTDPGLRPGARGRLLLTLLAGLGTLVIACINFINLLSARSIRRAPEVALRKLAGAQRGVLVVQFLAESVLYVLVALLLGVALVEMALPFANAFLETSMDFDYWREPWLLAVLMLSALLLGVLAGGYPALAMSAFRPLRVLKADAAKGSRGGWLRQGLVAAQFAILIGLAIAAGVVWQQRSFATGAALRVDADQMLLIRGRCSAPLADTLRQLPGVRGVACSDRGILGGFSIMTMKSVGGIEQLVFLSQLSPALFDLYGVRPLAGRLAGAPGGSGYVLNETAVRRLGYAEAARAIGVALPAPAAPGKPPATREVIGVVPDFSLTSVENRIEAMAYLVRSDDPGFDLASVRLAGQQVPETLAAIDAAWKQTGARDPVSRVFLEEYMQGLYTAMQRQAQLFTGFAVAAVVLACLGLLGLAASIAERRTREIGIRKALGAQTADVLRLLLWEFTRPVLWANLIAWPVAGWLMQRWLQGYAYHVDLPLWLFPLAGAVALLIALITVSVQAARVAGARPVAALRYE